MSLFEILVLVGLLIIAIEIAHARRLLAGIYAQLEPVIDDWHEKNIADDDE